MSGHGHHEPMAALLFRRLNVGTASLAVATRNP